MKNLFFLLFLFAATIARAGDYYEATLVFNDGKSKKGLVESPFDEKHIYFKASEKAEAEKIDATTVSKVIFKDSKGTDEFWQTKVLLGWGQKRVSEPMWLHVVEKGKATLMVRSTTMRSFNGLNSAGFQDYYCIRDGEPAAALICQVASMNNNQTFRAKAPEYFKDYPELAEKIKSKEYTWKDLVPVVQEYNKWATKK